jgi:hypothetical protein
LAATQVAAFSFGVSLWKGPVREFRQRLKT